MKKRPALNRALIWLGAVFISLAMWVAILALVGCDTCRKTEPALEVDKVIDAEIIENWCGSPDRLGCTYRDLPPGKATIILQAGLSTEKRHCVLEHELRHAQGYICERRIKNECE